MRFRICLSLCLTLFAGGVEAHAGLLDRLGKLVQRSEFFGTVDDCVGTMMGHEFGPLTRRQARRDMEDLADALAERLIPMIAETFEAREAKMERYREASARLSVPS